MATFLHRNGSWQAIVRRQGHSPQYQTFKRKLDAERWAHALEEQMHLGVYTPASGETITDLLTWYEQTLLVLRPGTSPYRLRTLREHLGAVVIQALTAHHCVEYAKARLGAGASSDTIRRELGQLGTALNSAKAFKRVSLPGNPVTDGFLIMRKLRTLEAPVRRERRLREGEEQLLLTARLKRVTQIQQVIAFALETAMRRGEIAALRRDDIDRKTATLRIRHSKTDWKTGEKGRVIPLSPLALEILLSLPARTDGRIWNFKDAHVITRAFERMCRQMGITDLRFHDLRHEAVSRLFERGYTIEQVAVWSGHRDWASLKRYTHPDPARLAASMKISR